MEKADYELIKLIDERVKKVVPSYLQGTGFSARKLTDTPTDSNQVVSRKYVTLNGNTASRPTSSVIGQSYFDTQINQPVWWNGSTFVDATGTPV